MTTQTLIRPQSLNVASSIIKSTNGVLSHTIYGHLNARTSIRGVMLSITPTSLLVQAFPKQLYPASLRTKTTVT